MSDAAIWNDILRSALGEGSEAIVGLVGRARRHFEAKMKERAPALGVTANDVKVGHVFHNKQVRAALRKMGFYAADLDEAVRIRNDALHPEQADVTVDDARRAIATFNAVWTVLDGLAPAKPIETPVPPRGQVRNSSAVSVPKLTAVSTLPANESASRALSEDEELSNQLRVEASNGSLSPGRSDPHRLRVYEAAVILEIDRTLAITVLQALGVMVRNHMSTIDNDAFASLGAVVGRKRHRLRLERARAAEREVLSAELLRRLASKQLPVIRELSGDLVERLFSTFTLEQDLKLLHEIASSTNVEQSVAISVLQAIGFPSVRNHMSAVDREAAVRLYMIVNSCRLSLKKASLEHEP